MSTTKFKRIGIGVAFSPNLKANIFEASRLALVMDSELVLVHVGEENEEKKATIDDHLASFSKRKLKYSVLFLPGAPVDIILSAIKKHDIDLKMNESIAQINNISISKSSNNLNLKSQ